jgi:hypothetical protein
VGLFDFVKRLRRSRKAEVARARELEGDFRGAAQRYLACGLRDEAARVMLLESDAEPRLERRIALASIAAETAQSEALIREARGRKARTALDVLRQSGRVAKAELCRVGAELEAAGEASLAAEAYALAGDDEGEARALTAAGAVERLEQRLRESADQERSARDEGLALARIGDLDQMGERGRALALAQKTPGERAAELARAIVARLARGPVVELELEGASQRVVLGDDVTLGRGDASISIAARAVSRRHLRVARGADGAPFVEDLGTANGTRVAGGAARGATARGRWHRARAGRRRAVSRRAGPVRRRAHRGRGRELRRAPRGAAGRSDQPAAPRERRRPGSHGGSEYARSALFSRGVRDHGPHRAVRR